MNKRTFLQTSGALLTGTLLSRYSASSQTSARTDTHRNWAGNYTFSTDNLHLPKSLEEVREVVKASKRIRAVGSRHSFNGIADSNENQISLIELNSMVVNDQARTVTVGAGVTYGHLAPYLQEKGYALHNLASLPHISVAGACATATHGSGDRNGNLATAVSALEFVVADGTVVTLHREKDKEHFKGAVVALGAAGVVTKVTLDLQPTFDVRQTVYENLKFDQLEKHFDEIFSAGDSVSLFSDWQNNQATQVWVKRRALRSKAAPAELFGAKLATRKLHPVAGHSAENCTEQMDIAGPWHERMPHFRMNFTPSSGDELQAEYFVPRKQAMQAIRAVESMRDQITPHLYITELRTIAEDDLWMSTAYKRPSVSIHFTWKPHGPAVEKLLPLIEEKLAPFQARPHWAKLYAMPSSTLKARYEKLPSFVALLKQYDPGGKFRNRYLQTNLGL